MATSINSYSVKLGMDASGFVDATKVSRSEARALIKDIEGARTPFEKFAAEQDRLGRALAKGGIDQATYNRLLESKRPAVEGVTSSLGAYTKAIGVVAAGITAASAATVAFIGHMRTIQGEIDDTADKAERLGISFRDLKGLEFGFKEGGGVDASTVGDSIKKMQINMAKAVEGDEGLRDAFAKLGLDAGELMGKGPREAMMAISDAMAGVGTHAERLKLSMEIFGKSGADLASTLGKGSEALESSVAFAEKWLGLTDSQVAAVGANNDAWDRISVVVEGITTKVAAELAPAFQIVADAILKGVEDFGGIDSAIHNAVTTVTVMAGTFMDILDVVGEINELIHAAATLDFDRMAKGLTQEALTMDKSIKAYAALEQNRADAKKSAEEAEKRRQEQRQAMAMEETDKEIKAKEDAQKKLEAEEKRAREEKAREDRKLAESALKAAEEHFQKEIERQKKMQEEVAKGPGAGMEANSAEAAKYMADQANRAIAESAVKIDAKPTDEQLVEEARKQLEFLQKDAVARDKKVDKLIETLAGNGWEAV